MAEKQHKPSTRCLDSFGARIIVINKIRQNWNIFFYFWYIFRIEKERKEISLRLSLLTRPLKLVRKL